MRDTDAKNALRMMSKTLKYFMDFNDSDNSLKDLELDIPGDVIRIIGDYFDISEWWLSQCYQDAIEFIKQKFLSLNENKSRKIFVYEVVAVIPDQIGKILKEVQ